MGAAGGGGAVGVCEGGGMGGCDGGVVEGDVGGEGGVLMGVLEFFGVGGFRGEAWGKDWVNSWGEGGEERMGIC